MSIRVLHILNELKPSGAEVMLKVAANIWSEFDIKADILSTGIHAGPYAQTLGDAGYGILHLPFRKNSPAFCMRLRKIIQSYDIVHLHTENGNFTIGMLVRLSGKPLIRTVHNAFDYRGLMRVIRGFQRSLLRWCGVVHVSIGATVNSVERGVLWNRSRLVPNWYDADKFNQPTSEERQVARGQLHIPCNTVVLAVVGNCSEIKNHSALFEAIAHKRHADVLVLHVGTGTHEELEKSLCKDLGIESAVRFMGRLDNPKTVLQCADIYVMPSLKEGFSIAALEAVGMGIPCIFSDVHGLRDLKDMFEKSCIWEPPTRNGMEQALENMLLKLDTFKAAATQGMIRCREEFGARNGVKRYAEIYSKQVYLAE